MKDLVQIIELCFFECRDMEALPYVAQFLDRADFDDDDDCETVRDLIVKGLRCAHADAFIDILAEKKFDFSMKWPKAGGLAWCLIDSGSRDYALLERLAGLGADPYLPNAQGETILHELCQKERSSWDTQLVPFTVEIIRRFDLDLWMLPDKFGATPLHYAALMGHVPVLAALVEKGADPDLRGTVPTSTFSHVIEFDGVTALQLACWMGHDEAAALLLKRGADASGKDPHGHAACHYAIRKPSTHYRRDFYASIPGADAVWEQKCKILRLLGSVDLCDDKGNTPFLCALSMDCFCPETVAATFIELGADVNHRNDRGETPLICAAGGYSKETLKGLLEAGADLDAQDREGNTALHRALHSHNTKLSRYLIGKGASFLLPNNAGKTAMDYAVENGLDDVLEKML